MKVAKEIRWSILTAVWLLVLTFPLMVIRVNTITDTIEWRWERLLLVGVGGVVVTFLWRFVQARQAERGSRTGAGPASPGPAAGLAGHGAENPEKLRITDRLLARLNLSRKKLRSKTVTVPAIVLILVAAIVFPLLTSIYQVNIMISALIYVILALGLNLVVGLGGMLHLGHAAFFAFGAYTYGLLYVNFGIGFWVSIPIAAVVAGLAGLLLGIPVLRLRGDYLAIVTLAFAEIVRIVLNNWSSFTNGPGGIKRIPRPPLFGVDFDLTGAIRYTYFIALGMVIVAIFIVHRLENSRLGRQWVAMGEDSIASRAMGVNTTRAKLAAFVLSSMLAGVAGVVFAGKTTFINPASFTVWQSVLILSAVVLGGMGSIPGVVVGALILMLLPEYLRAFADYRLLIFGGLLVVMMVFRPGGIIPRRRRLYRVQAKESEAVEEQS